MKKATLVKYSKQTKKRFTNNYFGKFFFLFVKFLVKNTIRLKKTPIKIKNNTIKQNRGLAPLGLSVDGYFHCGIDRLIDR